MCVLFIHVTKAGRADVITPTPGVLDPVSDAVTSTIDVLDPASDVTPPTPAVGRKYNAEVAPARKRTEKPDLISHVNAAKSAPPTPSPTGPGSPAVEDVLPTGSNARDMARTVLSLWSWVWKPGEQRLATAQALPEEKMARPRETPGLDSPRKKRGINVVEPSQGSLKQRAAHLKLAKPEEERPKKPLSDEHVTRRESGESVQNDPRLSGVDKITDGHEGSFLRNKRGLPAAENSESTKLKQRLHLAKKKALDRARQNTIVVKRKQLQRTDRKPSKGTEGKRQNKYFSKKTKKMVRKVVKSNSLPRKKHVLAKLTKKKQLPGSGASETVPQKKEASGKEQPGAPNDKQEISVSQGVKRISVNKARNVSVTTTQGRKRNRSSVRAKKQTPSAKNIQITPKKREGLHTKRELKKRKSKKVETKTNENAQLELVPEMAISSKKSGVVVINGVVIKEKKLLAKEKQTIEKKKEQLAREKDKISKEKVAVAEKEKVLEKRKRKLTRTQKKLVNVEGVLSKEIDLVGKERKMLAENTDKLNRETQELARQKEKLGDEEKKITKGTKGLAIKTEVLAKEQQQIKKNKRILKEARKKFSESKKILLNEKRPITRNEKKKGGKVEERLSKMVKTPVKEKHKLEKKKPRLAKKKGRLAPSGKSLLAPKKKLFSRKKEETYKKRKTAGKNKKAAQKKVQLLQTKYRKSEGTPGKKKKLSLLRNMSMKESVKNKDKNMRVNGLAETKRKLLPEKTIVTPELTVKTVKDKKLTFGKTEKMAPVKLKLWQTLKLKQQTVSTNGKQERTKKKQMEELKKKAPQMEQNSMIRKTIKLERVMAYVLANKRKQLLKEKGGKLKKKESEIQQQDTKTDIKDTGKMQRQGRDNVMTVSKSPDDAHVAIMETGKKETDTNVPRAGRISEVGCVGYAAAARTSPQQIGRSKISVLGFGNVSNVRISQNVASQRESNTALKIQRSKKGGKFAINILDNSEPFEGPENHDNRRVSERQITKTEKLKKKLNDSKEEVKRKIKDGEEELTKLLKDRKQTRKMSKKQLKSARKPPKWNAANGSQRPPPRKPAKGKDERDRENGLAKQNQRLPEKKEAMQARNGTHYRPRRTIDKQVQQINLRKRNKRSANMRRKPTREGTESEVHVVGAANAADVDLLVAGGRKGNDVHIDFPTKGLPALYFNLIAGVKKHGHGGFRLEEQTRNGVLDVRVVSQLKSSPRENAVPNPAGRNGRLEGRKPQKWGSGNGKLEINMRLKENSDQSAETRTKAARKIQQTRNGTKYAKMQVRNRKQQKKRPNQSGLAEQRTSLHIRATIRKHQRAKKPKLQNKRPNRKKGFTKQNKKLHKNRDWMREKQQRHKGKKKNKETRLEKPKDVSKKRKLMSVKKRKELKRVSSSRAKKHRHKRLGKGENLLGRKKRPISKQILTRRRKEIELEREQSESSATVTAKSTNGQRPRRLASQVAPRNRRQAHDVDLIATVGHKENDLYAGLPADGPPSYLNLHINKRLREQSPQNIQREPPHVKRSIESLKARLKKVLERIGKKQLIISRLKKPQSRLAEKQQNLSKNKKPQSRLAERQKDLSKNKKTQSRLAERQKNLSKKKTLLPAEKGTQTKKEQDKQSRLDKIANKDRKSLQQKKSKQVIANKTAKLKNKQNNQKVEGLLFKVRKQKMANRNKDFKKRYKQSGLLRQIKLLQQKKQVKKIKKLEDKQNKERSQKLRKQQMVTKKHSKMQAKQRRVLPQNTLQKERKQVSVKESENLKKTQNKQRGSAKEKRLSKKGTQLTAKKKQQQKRKLTPGGMGQQENASERKKDANEKETKKLETKQNKNSELVSQNRDSTGSKGISAQTIMQLKKTRNEWKGLTNKHQQTMKQTTTKMGTKQKKGKQKHAPTTKKREPINTATAVQDLNKGSIGMVISTEAARVKNKLHVDVQARDPVTQVDLEIGKDHYGQKYLAGEHGIFQVKVVDQERSQVSAVGKKNILLVKEQQVVEKKQKQKQKQKPKQKQKQKPTRDKKIRQRSRKLNILTMKTEKMEQQTNRTNKQKELDKEKELSKNRNQTGISTKYRKEQKKRRKKQRQESVENVKFDQESIKVFAPTVKQSSQKRTDPSRRNEQHLAEKKRKQKILIRKRKGNPLQLTKIKERKQLLVRQMPGKERKSVFVTNFSESKKKKQLSTLQPVKSELTLVGKRSVDKSGESVVKKGKNRKLLGVLASSQKSTSVQRKHIMNRNKLLVIKKEIESLQRLLNKKRKEIMAIEKQKVDLQNLLFVKKPQMQNKAYSRGQLLLLRKGHIATIRRQINILKEQMDAKKKDMAALKIQMEVKKKTMTIIKKKMEVQKKRMTAIKKHMDAKKEQISVIKKHMGAKTKRMNAIKNDIAVIEEQTLANKNHALSKKSKTPVKLRKKKSQREYREMLLTKLREKRTSVQGESQDNAWC